MSANPAFLRNILGPPSAKRVPAPVSILPNQVGIFFGQSRQSQPTNLVSLGYPEKRALEKLIKRLNKSQDRNDIVLHHIASLVPRLRTLEDRLDAVAAIESFLDHEHSFTRQAVTEALGYATTYLPEKYRIGRAWALERLLTDKDDLVCMAAIRALGQIIPRLSRGDRLASVLEIERRLNCSEEKTSVRITAMRAIDQVMDSLPVRDRLGRVMAIEACLISEEESLRANAVDYVVRITVDLSRGFRLDRARAIMGCFKHEDDYMRMVAVAALTDIIPLLPSEERLMPTLEIEWLLGDLHIDVHRTAAFSLGKILPELRNQDAVFLKQKVRSRLEDRKIRLRTRDVVVDALVKMAAHDSQRERLELALTLESQSFVSPLMHVALEELKGHLWKGPFRELPPVIESWLESPESGRCRVALLYMRDIHSRWKEPRDVSQLRSWRNQLNERGRPSEKREALIHLAYSYSPTLSLEAVRRLILQGKTWLGERNPSEGVGDRVVRFAKQLLEVERSCRKPVLLEN